MHQCRITIHVIHNWFRVVCGMCRLFLATLLCFLWTYIQYFGNTYSIKWLRVTAFTTTFTYNTLPIYKLQELKRMVPLNHQFHAAVPFASMHRFDKFSRNSLSVPVGGNTILHQTYEDDDTLDTPMSPKNIPDTEEWMDPASSNLFQTLNKGSPPLSPPPDLPSMLLHNRIVYLGLPISASVTELIITQLLYLNYESEEKPIFMYINSPGSETAEGKPASAFDTECFAISDVMKYICPPIHTIAIGQAWGSAAVLLSQGTKGYRFALPNTSILFRLPPRQAEGSVTEVSIKVNEALTNLETLASILSCSTGKSKSDISRDFKKGRFFDVEGAIEYGLVDKVLSSDKEVPNLPSFLRHKRTFANLSDTLPAAAYPQLSDSSSDLFVGS